MLKTSPTSRSATKRQTFQITDAERQAIARKLEQARARTHVVIDEGAFQSIGRRRIPQNIEELRAHLALDPRNRSSGG